MNRLLLRTSMVAAMLMIAASAFAAPGLNMAWSNCASEGGLPNRISACGGNLGQAGTLTGSFVLASPVAAVTGVEIIVDLITATSPFPAWWDAGGGGCRAGSITMNATVNGGNSFCFDWANGGGNGGLAAYGNDEGSVALVDQPAHRRILGGFAVGTGIALVANQEYFAFNVVINNALTTGAGSCAGCTVPACIVFNSINVVPGTDPPTLVGNAASAGSNQATWQGGSGANCLAVPVKNATWGQVKALYR